MSFRNGRFGLYSGGGGTGLGAGSVPPNPVLQAIADYGADGRITQTATDELQVNGKVGFNGATPIGQQESVARTAELDTPVIDDLQFTLADARDNIKKLWAVLDARGWTAPPSS